MNNLYWKALRTLKRPQEFHRSINGRIQEVVNLYKPSSLIYFALDGASPLAKIPLQRERRQTANNKRFLIDPLQLSPGTSFMGELKDHLCHTAAKIVDGALNPNMSVIISGGDNPDEGELKIFRHLNQSCQGDDLNLVVGSDSDIYLFALRSHCNIQILTLESETDDLVVINKMRENILKGVTTPKSKEQSVVDDFVFLCLLLGNDYLPRLKGFNMQTAWEVYLSLKKSRFQSENLFSEDSVIHQDFAFELLQELDFSAERYKQLFSSFPVNPKAYLLDFAQKFSSRNKIDFQVEDQPGGKFKATVFHDNVNLGSGIGSNKKQAEAIACGNVLLSSPNIENLIESLNPSLHVPALNFVKKFREKYVAPEPSENTPASEECIEDYYQGLGWSMKYLKGNCVNYGFHYPANSSPDIKSLLKYKKPIKLQHTDHPPLSAVEVLMAILPPEGKDYIPHQFQTLMDINSPVSEIIFEKNGKSKPWPRQSLIQNMNSIKSAIGELPEAHRHQPSMKIVRAHGESSWKLNLPPLTGAKAYKPTNNLLCHVEENSTFILKENKYMQQVIKREMRTRQNLVRNVGRSVLSFVKK